MGVRQRADGVIVVTARVTEDAQMEENVDVKVEGSCEAWAWDRDCRVIGRVGGTLLFGRVEDDGTCSGPIGGAILALRPVSGLRYIK